MPEKKAEGRTKKDEGHLPPAGSHAELVEFFDTHDMGEFLAEMPEVHLDIDLHHRTHLVELDDVWHPPP